MLVSEFASHATVTAAASRRVETHTSKSAAHRIRIENLAMIEPTRQRDGRGIQGQNREIPAQNRAWRGEGRAAQLQIRKADYRKRVEPGGRDCRSKKARQQGCRACCTRAI